MNVTTSGLYNPHTDFAHTFVACFIDIEIDPSEREPNGRKVPKKIRHLLIVCLGLRENLPVNMRPDLLDVSPSAGFVHLDLPHHKIGVWLLKQYEHVVGFRLPCSYCLADSFLRIGADVQLKNALATGGA